MRHFYGILSILHTHGGILDSENKHADDFGSEPFFFLSLLSEDFI